MKLNFFVRLNNHSRNITLSVSIKQYMTHFVTKLTMHGPRLIRCMMPALLRALFRFSKL